jgi:hypothetical protein
LATPARDGPPALLELTEAWRAQWPGLPPPNIPLRYLEEVRARWTELDRLDEAQLEARIKAPLARDAFAPDLSGWEQAMAHVRLAHPSFRPPDSTEADEWARVADRLESAVVLLERDHVSDIIYLGLRPSIAHLRRRANRLGSVDGAKMFATRDLLLTATEEAPFDAAAHEQLGLVQVDLNNSAAAENALRAAIDCRATGDVARWAGAAPLPHIPMATGTRRTDLVGRLAGVLLTRANRADAGERATLRAEALQLLAEASTDPDAIEKAWRVWFRLGVARRDTFDYRGASEAFALAWQAGTADAPLCALLAAESAFEADRHPEAITWADSAIQGVQNLTAAGRNQPFGFEVEWVLAPSDVGAFAAWIKGRVALQRDEPLRAYRLARATIRQASTDNVAASAGYSLAGEIRRQWAAKQASHRQRHLEAAIASYRKAEAIDLDTELAEREAAVLAELAELAELASDTRRAATLRHQALELLALAERLDLENRRERKRLQVAAMVGTGNGPGPNQAP